MRLPGQHAPPERHGERLIVLDRRGIDPDQHDVARRRVDKAEIGR
jgi:hypothetical protein